MEINVEELVYVYKTEKNHRAKQIIYSLLEKKLLSNATWTYKQFFREKLFSDNEIRNQVYEAFSETLNRYKLKSNKHSFKTVVSHFCKTKIIKFLLKTAKQESREKIAFNELSKNKSILIDLVNCPELYEEEIIEQALSNKINKTALQILCLKIQGYSNSEIAKIFKCPQKVILNKAYYLMKNIKKTIQKTNYSQNI